MSQNMTELWIPRSVGVDNLIRQINKIDCEYRLAVGKDTIRFSCNSPELMERLKTHTPNVREILIVN